MADDPNARLISLAYEKLLEVLPPGAVESRVDFACKQFQSDLEKAQEHLLAVVRTEQPQAPVR